MEVLLKIVVSKTGNCIVMHFMTNYTLIAYQAIKIIFLLEEDTLFARTYAGSRSFLQAVVEHSLWGNFIFTIGLGWYFYGGAIAG